MSRYIDADAAIQWVEENECYTDKFKRIMEGVIDKQPTVDAVPVEWIKAKIESLKSQGNEFASLSARIIQAMLNDYGADGERRGDEDQHIYD